MNINLPEPEQNYISSMVAAGYYRSKDELLCDAVRFLHAEYAKKQQKLAAALELGEKEIEIGNVVEYTDNFWSDCEKRVLENLESGKKPNPDVCA